MSEVNKDTEFLDKIFEFYNGLDSFGKKNLNDKAIRFYLKYIEKLDIYLDDKNETNNLNSIKNPGNISKETPVLNVPPPKVLKVDNITNPKSSENIPNKEEKTKIPEKKIGFVNLMNTLKQLSVK